MTERQVHKYKYMTNILYNVKVLSIKLQPCLCQSSPYPLGRWNRYHY